MARVEHLYGRAITFRYTPIIGDTEYVAYELVSARLYGPNSYPTADQIADVGQASTGHVGSRILEWDLVNEEGTGAAEHVIIFDAVEDASSNSGSEYDLFHVSLNYLAEAGGPELQDTEQIVLWRPDGLTSKIRVTARDVFNLESRVEAVMDLLVVEAKIDAAAEELMNRLEGRGYKKRRLFNLEKLNGAVRRLATAYCCLDLAGQGNQFWADKAALYRSRAEALFEIAQVGFDSEGTDNPSPERVIGSGPVFITR